MNRSAFWFTERSIVGLSAGSAQTNPREDGQKDWPVGLMVGVQLSQMGGGADRGVLIPYIVLDPAMRRASRSCLVPAILALQQQLQGTPH